MLSEKNTLCRPALFWFTGCRARSSGHLPFCSRASISVPGAPALSLATRSQELASNPGVEIRAPDWVAVALLATRQPDAPRLETLLAPADAVPVAEVRAAGCVAAWPGAVIRAADEGVARAPEDSQTRDVATRAKEAQTASGGRMARFTAGNS